MEFSLAQVQEVTGAQMLDANGDLPVRGWSIDSRTLNKGDLFFAIKGERSDGHTFVESAFERGAAGAVVSEEATHAGPLLRVPDTLQALQTLAQWARRQWARPVVAVTGSAGKTSTKEIIAACLGVRFRTGKTTGNLNNHLGLPLTLLRLPEDAEVAVVEIGMNHSGEIRHLAAIAEPQIGVITNVGYAHVEFFDSIDGVAAAKRELVEALPQNGVAILNADDERVFRFREAHRGRSITYGLCPHADIRAENLELHAGGAVFTVDGVRFETALAGRHSISNILAGLAVATAFHVPLSELTPVVAGLLTGKMRGERYAWRGATVLDDSYNSNPEAARSMLDVLRDEPARRRIAVLGEMLELGHMAERLHRELGAYAAQSGVDVLVGVRGASRLMVEEAQKAGLAGNAALFFEDPEPAGDFLREFVRPGDAILFKGSRGTHVERALAAMER
ncbi:MAG TPA: UDP-N-acetylmuramoyl-tripeptide--D-alanyl-D-alanine ligase [Bryobacteraceae bacterium]|jgi:UDP-N-acetylmuramoyl-tripeptide--D-alanyl-D-alanine ligase